MSNPVDARLAEIEARVKGETWFARINRLHAFLPFNLYDEVTKPAEQAVGELVEDRAWLLALLKEHDERSERLRVAVEHVINDSPGTPDSVKRFLREATSVARSGGEPA